MTQPEDLIDWPSNEVEPLAFFSEWEDYNPPEIKGYIPWFVKILEEEGVQLVRIHFIFCTDAYLHTLNLDYLQHDSLTDIITFPYQDPPSIEGDIFISIERVRDNAKQLGITEKEELSRVMIHGVYHLCGYQDKTSEEKKRMTQKEDQALLLKQQLNPS